MENVIIKSSLVLLLTFCMASAEATIVWDDGEIHNVSTATNQDVILLNSYPENISTTLNLLSYGRVGTISTGDSSLYLYHTCIANIYPNSDVEKDIYANYQSEVTIYGGLVKGNISTFDNSRANLKGGTVGLEGKGFLAYDDSKVTLTAGSVSYLVLRQNSTIIIAGYGFKINNEPVIYGTYTALDFTSGKLTGKLVDENLFTLNASFKIFDNAQIILVPEPATLLLLGLGAVMLRRRTKIS